MRRDRGNIMINIIVVTLFLLLAVGFFAAVVFVGRLAWEAAG